MTKKQRELSQQLSKALDQASQPKSPEELGKLADEHKRTSQQTGELEREFEERAKQPGNERLGKAAEKLGKSKGQLDQAERHTRNGKTDDAEKARAQAIQQMKSAIESSGLKLDQTQAKPNTDANSPAGKLLREAVELMQKAPPHAPTMQQAGGKIRNAAESLQRGNGPGPSEKSDTPAPEVSQPEMKEPDIVLKNLGKPWGELPGDIRNQITQELKAKYGEDYARIIKLYFEQLADRKSP
jgi:hypothetical protein